MVCSSAKQVRDVPGVGIKGDTQAGELFLPFFNIQSRQYTHVLFYPTSRYFKYIFVVLNTCHYLSHPNMSSAYYQYQPTGSLPVNVPGKQPQPQSYARHNRNSSGYSQYSVSPPERPESVSTSGAGVYSSASSQYGGSEYDSTSSGATSVDLLDYMNDRLSQTYNPIPLDKKLAKQAQM